MRKVPTIRELRARFTAQAEGMKAVARSVKKELQSIGETSEKSVRKTNKSFGDLNNTLDDLEKKLDKAGDSKKFESLRWTIRDARNEIAQFGKVSESTLFRLQKQIRSNEADIKNFTDITSDGFDDIVLSIESANEKSKQLNIVLDDTEDKFIDVQQEVKETDDGLEKLRETVMDVTTILRALQLSLAGLALGAPPAIASITTAAGGLVSSFTAAGAGVAGFAAVAIPNLTQIFEAYEDINKAQEKYQEATTEKEKAKALEDLQVAYRGLSDEQRRAVESLLEFRDYFESLRQEFEKPVLNLFVQGLQTAKTLLELFKPVIDVSIEAINNLMASLDQALQTKDVESFFGFLTSRAGPAIEAWGQSFGNVMLGVMHLIMAFDEQAVQMQNSILGLTQRFAEWSASLKDSEGFKEFIEYSNRNTPILLGLLNNLWNILKNVSVFLAPLGEVFLELLSYVTEFLELVTKGLATLAQWEGFIPVVMGLTSAFLALKASMMFSNVLSWITGLLNPMTRALVLTQLWTKAQAVLNATLFANPIGLITALIVGLGVTLVTAYKKSETFRNVVNNAFASIRNAAQVAFEYIKSISISVWDGLTQGASTIGSKIISGFNTAKQTVTGYVSKFGEEITEFFGQGLTEKARNVVQGFIEQLKAGFSSFGGIVSLITPTLTAIGLSLMGITGPIGIVITAIVSFIGMLYRLSKTNEDVRNALSNIWASLKTIFSSVITALQPIIDVFAQSFSQMARELGPEFQKTGQIIAQSISELEPSLVQLMEAFGELFATIAQIIPDLLPIFSQLLQGWIQVSGTLLSSIIQIATSVLPMLVQAFQQIFPMVLSVVQAILPIAVQLILSLIPVILQLAQAVIPLILQSVQMVFPIVLQIIQAVLPIIIALFRTIIPIITEIAKVLIPLILQVVQSVFPVVLSIIQTVIPIVIQLLRMTATIITTVLIPAIRFILQVVQAVFPVIMSVIKNGINIITNIIKLFTSILKADWKSAWDAVKNILSSAWNIIKSIFSGLFNTVSSFVSKIWQNITNGWNIAKDKTAEIFNNIRNKVRDTFNEIVGWAKGLPGRIGDGIKSMSKKAVDGATELTNRLLKGLGKGVNGVIRGVNWVLGKIGVDSKIPEWKVPQYKKGTEGHPGGLAIVGDGKKKELIITPDGQVALSPATDTLVNLPEGTKVLSGDDTQKLINAGIIPAYKKGNISLSDIWDMITNPTKLFTKILKKFGIKTPDFPGILKDFGNGIFNKIKDAFLKFLKDKLPKFDFGGGNISENVKKWIAQAITITKVPASWARPLAIIAMKESGGNPRAINNWDINAKRGIASRGLMQTIPPTFNAYKLPGYNDIWNPVHNAIAAIRYIIARYGTVFNVPGIKSMARGGSYRGFFQGARVAVKQLAWIAEKGPEYIIPADGSQRSFDLWYQAGLEIGALRENTDESQIARVDQRVIDLLQQIARGIEQGFNAQIIMNDREVGRMIEPHVTEIQRLNERINKEFRGR